MPEPVTDAAPLGSGLLYGAQKHMVEVLLSHYAARGWLDAISLRPAGVMAREGADAALKTAFMSQVFYAVRQSRDITLPVAADSRTWLASVETVARNFVHAVQAPELGAERALTLPALSLTFRRAGGRPASALSRQRGYRFSSPPTPTSFSFSAPCRVCIPRPLTALGSPAMRMPMRWFVTRSRGRISMRFSTLPDGTPDGRLHLVSRDNSRAQPCAAARTMQAALEGWEALRPALEAEYAALNAGGGSAIRPGHRDGAAAARLAMAGWVRL